MPGLFFVSYRRSDSDIWADRLAGELRAQSVGKVFMDIREIAPGTPWRTVLDTALGSCTALLVVIGPAWLNSTDQDGRRRLDDPSDILRNEVAEALRKGTRVVPVLVNGARMPSASELPEDIQSLTELQAHDLTVKHWSNDIAHLIGTLQAIVSGNAPHEDPQPAPRIKGKRSLVLRAGISLLSISVLAGLSALAYFRIGNSPESAFRDFCAQKALGCFSIRSTKECDATCTKGVADTLRQRLGVQASAGAPFDESPAGCIGFRPDLGGTLQMAELVQRVLGTGYYIGDCTHDGFPINVRTKQPAG